MAGAKKPEDISKIKVVDVDKPDDYVEVIIRIPRARLFVLDGENGKNEEYEALLLQIEKLEVEHSSSSGNWHEGQYRVQVHYFEIEKKKELRKDTDFTTSTEEEVAEKDQQKKAEDEKTKDEEKKVDEEKKPDEEPVEIREDVISFDSKMDEPPKSKKGKKKSKKTGESTKKET